MDFATAPLYSFLTNHGDDDMTSTDTITATPAKLRNGSWGARVQGQVRNGDTVTITTRAGKSWTATVSQVVWTGEGVSIVATESRPSRPQYRVVSQECCGYPCPVTGRKCTPTNPCHDCQ
mgnify:FL=1